MKKKLVFSLIVVVIFSLSYYFYNKNNQPSGEKLEQQVYSQTLTISKNYASLRYQTDNILIGDKEFLDYDAWNNEMTTIINKWNDLEKDATSLEKLAEKMADDKLSIKFIPEVHAYTNQEVTNIFQKAPAGKKIITLAKHLGVDAKMAQLILNQTQDYISREAYGGEGDVAATYENSAIVIKNTSKVAVFVGTIAISAPVGILAKTAVIVSGADLTLEITDDTAKMALGNNNKVSAIAGDVRKITEPVAAILTIATLPNKLVDGIDKLNAVVFGADQLNSTIQAGSVVGIKLPTYIKENPGKSYEVSVLESDEIEQWIKDKVPDSTPETMAEIEKILKTIKLVEESPSVAEEESNKTTKNEIKLMPVKEFEKIFDDKLVFKNVSKTKKIFGEPDEIHTLENGYGDYVYHRRLVYPNGNIAGMMIRFENLEVSGYSIMMEEYK